MSDYTPPNNNNQPRRRAPQQATRRRNTDNYNNDSFDEQPRNANRGNNRNYQDEYEERTYNVVHPIHSNKIVEITMMTTIIMMSNHAELAQIITRLAQKK